MRIGELADAVGLPTRTIRYYERRGLLPEPERAANGYRVYNDRTLSRLRFIRTAQAAGLTLAEIRGIIVLRDEGSAPCEHVSALLQAKLVEVGERMGQLQHLEADLTRLIRRSRSLDPADCVDGAVCHILQK